MGHSPSARTFLLCEKVLKRKRLSLQHFFSETYDPVRENTLWNHPLKDIRLKNGNHTGDCDKKQAVFDGESE